MATIKGLKNRLSAAGRALAGDYIVAEDGKPTAAPTGGGQESGNSAQAASPRDKDRSAAEDGKKKVQPAEAGTHKTNGKQKTQAPKSDPVRFPRPESPTIEMLDRMHCCGCGACMNSCPVNAITMKTNDMGFIVPEVDHDKCVRCGKCKKACPVISPKYENNPHPSCYAVMADEATREDSSSGGAFTLLATEIINSGGYVCGVRLMDDFSVKHVIINSMDELPALRRSKYVQSDTGDTFSQVKKLLDADNLVMFTGCPCQVAGLKNFLGKDYQKLLAVDLVCHGGPPQKVFRRYLEDTYGIENLADFKFRTKKYGYTSFWCEAVLKNGEELPGFIRYDAFETAMHSGMAVNDLCADCPFAPTPRQGDITIGDFWGNYGFKKEIDDQKGISCVLVNNDKGREYIDKIAQKASVFREESFDEIRGGNRFGSKMRIPLKARTWLYNCLDYQPMNKVVWYASTRRFDVGLMGVWNAGDYGCMASYYALYQVLKEQFHLSVLLVDTMTEAEEELRRDMTEEQLEAENGINRQMFDVSKKYTSKNAGILNTYCDTFVLGPGRCLDLKFIRQYKQLYYLGFARNDKKRIAYASSFGKEFSGSAQEQLVGELLLKKFDYLSAGDTLTSRTLSDKWGIDSVSQTIDPAFLIGREEYEVLSGRSDISQDEDYILADMKNITKDKLDMVLAASNRLGRKVILLTDLSEIDKEMHIAAYKQIQPTECNLMYDWLWYYSHADAVITDSYYGSVFSIVYGKPFAAVPETELMERFTSLLEHVKLENRIFQGDISGFDSFDLLENADYVETYEQIDKAAKISIQWLDDALKSEKVYMSDSIYSLRDVK